MSYASAVLADSPRAWYRMSEASGLIGDSSGNAMNSDASTGTCNYHQPSLIESDSSNFSIQFTGTQFFEVPDNPIIDLGDVFTVESWMKRTTSGLPASEVICDRGDNAFRVGIAGGDFAGNSEKLFLAISGVGAVVFSTITITDTLKHHLVVTKNGATSKMYIDAVDVTGVVTNFTSSDVATKLTIGARILPEDFNQSYMDEIALYATPLSAARVLAHYQAAFLSPTLSDDPPIGLLGGSGW